ncbi:MAG: hypothetical protein ACXWKP_09650 [Bradyrhizobium sp.]
MTARIGPRYGYSTVIHGTQFSLSGTLIFNYVFIIGRAKTPARPAGKSLINRAKVSLHLRPGANLAKITGEKVQTMSNASMFNSSGESGLFNQIAMFSIAGLSSSMAMAFVGGLQIVYPWF